MKPSGRFWARYTGPDVKRPSAGSSAARGQAEAALAAVPTDLLRGQWVETNLAAITFAALAEQARQLREDELGARTQRENASMSRKLLPVFGHKPVNRTSARDVDAWCSESAAHPVGRRTAYFLTSTIFRFAVRWGYTKARPCQIEKAGRDVSANPTPTIDYASKPIGLASSKSDDEEHPSATLAELGVIAALTADQNALTRWFDAMTHRHRLMPLGRVLRTSRRTAHRTEQDLGPIAIREGSPPEP